MNVKITYHGEAGFRQSLKNVYEYLIPSKKITFEEFLKYKQNDTGKTNAELVYDRMKNIDPLFLYNDEAISKLYDETDEGFILKPFKKIEYIFYNSNKLICPTPCNFYIDSENVSEGIILQSSNLMVTKQNGYSNYNDDNDTVIFDLIQENAKRNNLKGDMQSQARRRIIKPMVWVWCKSLCPDNKFKANSIFNLTPFINSISTNETESGGNFNIILNSVEGEMSDKGDLKSIWSPSSQSYVNIENHYLFRKVRNKFQYRDQYPDRGNFDQRENPYESDFYKRGNSNGQIGQENLVLKNDVIKSKVNKLFENLLSPNDVVFISFDTEQNDIVYTEDFFTDNTKLPYLQWDMIGLVNNISSSDENEGNSSTESLSGMDCMKLLIEDGTYFFMNSAGSDSPTSLFENIQINTQGDQSNVGFLSDKISSSNRVPMGIINSLYISTQRNINFVMNVLFSKLCNVEICPTELFEGYEDKTVYKIPILQNTEKK